MSRFYEGEVVIVTGGGHGLGEAYCRELGRAGACVVVNDLDADRAEAVAGAIRDAGGEAAAVAASVSTREGARAIADGAQQAFGTIDAVVNNAGFMANARFEDLTEAMLDAMLEVHVKGAFFVTQAAWPTLRDKGYGRVVFTSSSGGMFASSGRANYAAAKAGIYGLMKALAFEGREHGIKVNAILPFASTGISSSNPVPGHNAGYPPGLLEAFKPLRVKEAVAPLVAYLASSACDVTAEAYSAGMGHFARVFVGAAHGWASSDPSAITVEDIEEHFDEIRDLERFTVPQFIYDEFVAIADAIGLTYG